MSGWIRLDEHSAVSDQAARKEAAPGTKDLAKHFNDALNYVKVEDGGWIPGNGKELNQVPLLKTDSTGIDKTSDKATDIALRNAINQSGNDVDKEALLKLYDMFRNVQFADMIAKGKTFAYSPYTEKTPSQVLAILKMKSKNLEAEIHTIAPKD